MNHRIAIAAACSLLLIAIAGCRQETPENPTPDSGGSMGSYSWSPTASDVNSVPGIDQAHLWCWWVSKKPLLLVWTDIDGAKGQSSDTPDGGFAGQLADIPIEYSAKSKTLTIDGTDYSTKNGAVFLISTQSEKPIVKQLARDLAKLDIVKNDGTGIDNSKLKSLAKSDSDISAFFNGPSKRQIAP